MQDMLRAPDHSLNQCRFGAVVVGHDDVDLAKQVSRVVVTRHDLAFLDERRKAVRNDDREAAVAVPMLLCRHSPSVKADTRSVRGFFQ